MTTELAQPVYPTTSMVLEHVIGDDAPDEYQHTLDRAMRALGPVVEDEEQAIALGRSDDHLDAPTASLHLNLAEVVIPLLYARGWKRTARGGWESPTGYHVWETDEALTVALTTEAVALRALAG